MAGLSIHLSDSDSEVASSPAGWQVLAFLPASPPLGTCLLYSLPTLQSIKPLSI